MLLRSMLFTPGNNMRMIAKAGERGADAVILDLEDAVPMDDKETARLFVRDSLTDVASGGSMVFVRVNASTTGLLADDLEWIVREGLDGIMLPKTESYHDVQALEASLVDLEGSRSLKKTAVLPLIETAQGVLNAPHIASSSKRICAIALGGVDFSRDMGVDLTAEGDELLFARGQLGVSARAAGVMCIDTPCLAARDRDALRTESTRARQLGFTGKLAIHPSQVEGIHEAFSPSPERIAQARRIVEAFAPALEAGLGAISLDGKMIDAANYQQARDTIAMADTIAAREHDKRKA